MSRLAPLLLHEPRPVYLAIGVPLAALVVAAIFVSSTSDRFRFTGLALELIGIASVVWGLADTLKVFERPSLGVRLAGWWKRLLDALTGRPLNHVLTMEPGRFSMTGGRANINVHASANATLEQRVRVLEQQMDATDTRLAGIEKELDSERKERAEVMERERLERQQSINDLRKKLEAVAVGGFDLELTGIAWVMIGLVFSTIPDELAGLIAA